MGRAADHARYIRRLDPEVTGARYTVLNLAVSFGDYTTGADIRPSQELLAELSGLHVETVRTTLLWLVERGHLRHVGGKGRRNSVKCYRLNMAWPQGTGSPASDWANSPASDWANGQIAQSQTVDSPASDWATKQTSAAARRMGGAARLDQHGNTWHEVEAPIRRLCEACLDRVEAGEHCLMTNDTDAMHLECWDDWQAMA